MKHGLKNVCSSHIRRPLIPQKPLPLLFLISINYKLGESIPGRCYIETNSAPVMTTRFQQDRYGWTLGRADGVASFSRSGFPASSEPVVRGPPWYNRSGWMGVKHQVTYLSHTFNETLPWLSSLPVLMQNNSSRVGVVIGKAPPPPPPPLPPPWFPPLPSHLLGTR